jgi:hypothetical protein
MRTLPEASQVIFARFSSLCTFFVAGAAAPASFAWRQKRLTAVSWLREARGNLALYSLQLASRGSPLATTWVSAKVCPASRRNLSASFAATEPPLRSAPTSAQHSFHSAHSSPHPSVRILGLSISTRPVLDQWRCNQPVEAERLRRSVLPVL